MLEAPIGGASFANEFGRPNLAGYFRTYEQQTSDSPWGYHKPIMIAGGLGNIRDQHVQKNRLPVGSLSDSAWWTSHADRPRRRRGV